MAYTDTGGGDHEGEDWTPITGTYAGIHYNIGTFTCGGGVTMTVSTGVALDVNANTISVVGTIDGSSKGYAGGAGRGVALPGLPGDGACGGGVGGYNSGIGYSGGGGGGYGGGGGAGGNNGALPGGGGGGICGLGTYITFDSGSGSGGGSGGYSVGPGGRGGGWITLVANSITVTGTIQFVGQNGQGTNFGGCGGGAGGMGLLIGCSVTITDGTFVGDGGAGESGDGSGGGW